jgi:hypothetical protein
VIPNEGGMADFQLVTDLWPTVSGGEVGMAFDVARLTNVVTVYTFCGFGYNYNAAVYPNPTWSVAQHSQAGNRFFDDDAIPANEDPIMGYGTLGFGMPGYTPCPGSQGACCHISGACTVVLEAGCISPSIWHPEWTTCAPNLCPQPGECCYADGTCAVTLPSGCTENWTQGGTCSPNTCPQPDGACCAPNGDCTVTNLGGCPGGPPAWTMFGVCEPNACPQPTGACCNTPVGMPACTITTLADCQFTWLGADVPCDAVTCPAPPLPGACCVNCDEFYEHCACLFLTREACQNSGGDFLGEGISCDPDLCLGESDPCIGCDAAEYWVDSCKAGKDIVLDHFALAGLELYAPLTCDGADMSYILSSRCGLLIINRTDPRDDSVHFPGTSQLPATTDVIDLELEQACLFGNGLNLRIGAGKGVGEHGGLLKPSYGAIVRLPEDPHLARSFFDLFFEVQVGRGFLYNHDAMAVETTISCVPPESQYLHLEGCVPLYDHPDSGAVVYANLLSARHALFVPAVLPVILLVYLNGDNGLDANSFVDFNEMEMAANNPNVKIIVCWDRFGYGNSVYYDVQFDPNPNALATYIEGVNKWSSSIGIGELDMGNPVTLTNFTGWAIRRFPGRMYCLDIWNDGLGWAPRLGRGISWDDTDGSNFLTTNELRDALTIVKGQLGGNNLDVFGMDACLMEMVEVAYAVRGQCECVVGSEELEPADGWEYNLFIPGITPATMAPDLCRLIVRSYPWWTQSAFYGGTGMIQLATAVSTLATAMMNNMGAERNSILAARGDTSLVTFDYDGDMLREVEDSYVDLGHLSQLIKNACGAQEVRNAAANVILQIQAARIDKIYSVPEYAPAQGISIYFPVATVDSLNGDDLYANYQNQGTSPANLDFVADTQWDEFLALLLTEAPITPWLRGAYATGPTTVRVQFDVDLDPTTAEVEDNYELLSGASVAYAELDPVRLTTVNLTIGTPAPAYPNNAETITVNGVKSAGGILMSPNQSTSFRSGLTTIYDIQHVTNQAVRDSSVLVGEVVTLEATVTAVEGNYCYLQQGSGAWKGLYCRVAKSGDIALGNRLQVSGEVTEYVGMTELVYKTGVDNFRNLGTDPTPFAVNILTPSLLHYRDPAGFDFKSAEPWEGCLVKLLNATFRDSIDGVAGPYFDEWLLASTPATADTAMLDMTGMTLAGGSYDACPGNRADITGILFYADGKYRIYPRTGRGGDIRELYAAPGCPTTDVDSVAQPAILDLRQNRPNPFGIETAIAFALPHASQVRLEVVDVSGRLVRVLTAGPLATGEHVYQWDGMTDAGRRAAAGTYFYRLRCDGRETARRMVLLN